MVFKLEGAGHMAAVRDGVVMRVLALLATLALAVGVASCGEDSGDGGGEGGSSAKQASPSGDESDVKALVADLEEAFKTRDTKTICAKSTAAVQKQIKQLEGYPTCAQGLRDFLTDDPTGDSTLIEERYVVKSIRVSGRTASVVGDRAGNSRQGTARFAKEDGEWKLVNWFGES
jgi:ketosteroid isomerase-like protein